MINKRLIQMLPHSMKAVYQNVICQWLMLLCNIVMTMVMCRLLHQLMLGQLKSSQLIWAGVVLLVGMMLRYGLSKRVVYYGWIASTEVKTTLREKILKKIYRLGLQYRSQMASSEVVQLSVEGVEQLETYFGAYLPQFFYAMLAPLTLFVVIVKMDWKVAVVLLVCVPLIPLSIVAVQKIAKRLFYQYWGSYTELGDVFLENLQGLTTLKIYQSDEMRHQKMNEEAELFRKMTMRVLTMQLNSITVMDIVAYGGAAMGIIFACQALISGSIRLDECLCIVLLSADFFIPMRQLGSYFHVAMNGMAACDKFFHLLDLPEPKKKTLHLDGQSLTVTADQVSFCYDPERLILNQLNLTIVPGQLTALVGPSGCGKSTFAHLLCGERVVTEGNLRINGLKIHEIAEDDVLRLVTYVGHQSYLFKGTVRENLQMADPLASDEKLWEALKKVRLDGFLAEQDGLDTQLQEKGSNFSGGQCQRLALCRALLHDSPMYIFDEATSNIDPESEETIMQVIYDLAKTKTVLLIAHRLASVVRADAIAVMDKGQIVELGTHASLMAKAGLYQQLFMAQMSLENLKGGIENGQ